MRHIECPHCKACWANVSSAELEWTTCSGCGHPVWLGGVEVGFIRGELLTPARVEELCAKRS